MFDLALCMLICYVVYLTAEMEKEDVEIDEWDDENIKNPEEHEMVELEVCL